MKCDNGEASIACTDAGGGVTEGSMITDKYNLHCMSCPKGYSCPDGSFDNKVACPPGTTSLDGERDCTPCPDGSYCLTTTDERVECEDGYYSLEG